MTQRLDPAVKAEREAAADYAELQCGVVAQLVKRGRISGEEADLLSARLKAFALGLRAGLHVEDGR